MVERQFGPGEHSGCDALCRCESRDPEEPMATATVRFYEELNDFLPAERRGREFDSPCARAVTSKHMIEAAGVPHTEVELILVNGKSVGFERQIRDGDRVAVYPTFEAFDIRELLRVHERPLRRTRFIADAHFGGLARLLRMAGLDTLYDNGYEAAKSEAIAARQGRSLRLGASHCFARSSAPLLVRTRMRSSSRGSGRLASARASSR